MVQTVTQGLKWPLGPLNGLMAKSTNEMHPLASQAALRHSFQTRLTYFWLILCSFCRLNQLNVCELVSGKLHTRPSIALFLYNRPVIALIVCIWYRFIHVKTYVVRPLYALLAAIKWFVPHKPYVHNISTCFVLIELSCKACQSGEKKLHKQL